MLGRLIAVFIVLLLLSGCICPATGGAENPGNGAVSGSTAGGSANGGGVVVVTQNTSGSGGMSDPSKCRNLPPQEMADCLQNSMGG